MSEPNAIAINPPSGAQLVRIPAFNKDIAAIQAVFQANIGGGGLTEFDLQRIKMPTGGSTFYTVPDLDGDRPVKDIRCVVLFVRSVRVYWKKSYEESGGGTLPDCHSLDGKTGVGNPGGKCETCPMNGFGSAARGGGKACQEVMQLFVLRDDTEAVLPEIFAVKPGSLKTIKEYLNKLSSNFVPICDVITEISMAEKRAQGGTKYMQATFRRLRPLDPEEKQKSVKFAEMYQGLVKSNAQTAAQAAAQAAAPQPDSEDQAF